MRLLAAQDTLHLAMTEGAATGWLLAMKTNAKRLA